MAFSDKILALRKQRAWSQERLAEELHVSRQAVSKWESGLAMPDLAKLKEVSGLFGLTLDELVNDAPLPAGAAPQEESPGAALQDVEVVPAPRRRPARRTILWVAALAAVALLAAAALLLWPKTPDYTQPEAIAEYLADTVNLRQPYSQIYLNDLAPEHIRAQMENGGIQVTVTNEVLEQARRQFLGGYFAAFEPFGLRYDVDGDALYFNDRPVSYFEDYSVESTLSLVAWVGEVEEMAIVIVERNHRGSIVMVEDISTWE